MSIFETKSAGHGYYEYSTTVKAALLILGGLVSAAGIVLAVEADGIADEKMPLGIGAFIFGVVMAGFAVGKHPEID